MSSEVQSRYERSRLFCIRNFLPLGFLVALLWALTWPLLGEAVSKPMVEGYRITPTINAMIIFVISGLTLKTDDIENAMGKEGRRGYIYGVVSILGITSCVGFLAVGIPFKIEEFSYGLAVFCVVPTTMSSSITLVMNAGGNDALALLLTATSNLLGVVTVPFFVKAVISAEGAGIDAVELLVKLVITILVPLGIGKIVQEAVPEIQAWVKLWKLRLSLTKNFMVIMIVWQTLSRGQEVLTSVAFDQILVVAAAGIVLHFIYLSINYVICRFVLRLELREFKAVVFMSSQKSLVISLAVISFLGGLGDQGLMTIPCIIGHLFQVFIDAHISSRWANKVEVAAVSGAAVVAGTEAEVNGETV